MSAPARQGIDEAVHWLVNGAPGAQRPEHIVEQLCARLVGAGLPLRRVGVFVRTLHPTILGMTYIWRRGEPMTVSTAPRSIIDDPDYGNSPLKPAFEEGRGVRRRLADPSCPRDFPILAEFDVEGVTDYVVSPLRFLSGKHHVVTWATKAAGGFSDADIAAIDALVPPMARLAEIYTLGRTATNLLNVYVGHDAGERILNGQIGRGETTTLEAAI
jgi:adenylate cyclase